MILPIVEQRFREQDWRLRESAVLAIGAVSEGCTTGLTPFLPQLIDFLVPTLEDPRPMLRSTACWTLSRFSRWVVQLAFAARPGDPPPATAAQGKQFVEKILGGLLRRVADKNKHVQIAACGALATFEAEAREDIAPWLGPVVAALGGGGGKLQTQEPPLGVRRHFDARRECWGCGSKHPVCRGATSAAFA